MQALRCAVPYELEGMLRREVALAGVALLQVDHGSLVEFHLSLPEAQAASFRQRVDDSGQGRIAWIA